MIHILVTYNETACNSSAVNLGTMELGKQTELHDWFTDITKKKSHAILGPAHLQVISLSIYHVNKALYI